MDNAGQNNKRITLGILAHVDAGKTTLSEAILFKTGEIRKLGRVDHGDAFLDDNELERNRGITIFSKQARFMVHGASGEEVSVTLIDTPGHVDFTAEMERALSVIDCGLLVVSGSEGVQAHTRTLVKMLRDRRIPTFVFVNKMDIAVRCKEEILDELAGELGIGAVDFSDILAEKPEPDKVERFIDAVTLYSPELAEIVLESEAEGEGEGADILSDTDIAVAISRCEIVPCVFGSALKLEGIERLLQLLGRFSNEPARKEDFGARVYKVSKAEDGTRICFIKVTGGALRVRDKVTVKPSGDEVKIDQIRLYSGSKFTTVDSVSAGEVCAVTGLGDAMPGDAIGDEAPETYKTEPYMVFTIEGPADRDSYLVMKDIAKLAQEDPSLDLRWRSDTSEIEIRLMGQVQKEVLSALIKERFGYDVTYGNGKVLYLETVAEAYEGVGHFEPLRHYAEAHIVVEPAERGSGITITSVVPEDELARNWQRLIMTHMEEKEHLGVLTGAPLTDVKLILCAGRAHEKHTSGGDFREATYRAIRNALMKARAAGKAVLLEPWYEYEMDLPSQSVGRAMMDIKQMGGTQDELEQNGEVSKLKGTVPAAEIADYQQLLTGYTSGTGKLACTPLGYRECHDAEAVIEAYGYDPERDVENTGDSVFVTHGASDIVRWDRVDEKMHLPYSAKRRSPGSQAHGGSSGHRIVGGSRGGAATDAELRRIFERTYGPVKERLHKAARVIDNWDDWKEKDDPRNQEIKAKHERKAGQAKPAEPVIVIVDGYNLINSDAYLSDLAGRDIGAARLHLLDRLSNFAAYTGQEVTVVFDAYKVQFGGGSREEHLGVKVIFTKENEPADIRIGLLTNSLGDREVYVVSSDALVQQNSLGHGALRISSHEFFKRLGEVEEEIRKLLC